MAAVDEARPVDMLVDSEGAPPRCVIDGGYHDLVTNQAGLFARRLALGSSLPQPILLRR